MKLCFLKYFILMKNKNKILIENRGGKYSNHINLTKCSVKNVMEI